MRPRHGSAYALSRMAPCGRGHGAVVRAPALLALAALTLLAACRGGSAPAPTPQPRQIAPPLEPVRVLYAEPSPALLPYWLAIDGGLFARNGLQPELREAQDPQTAYTQLVSGAADVYLAPLAPPLVAQAAEGADVVVLGGTPELAIVATRRFLASREVILERFLRSTLEGIHAVQAQPALARDVLAHRGGLSPAEADAALHAFQTRPPERVPYLSRGDLEPVIAARAAEDPRAAALDADRLLEQTVLRRLEASGFVAALYRA